MEKGEERKGKGGRRRGTEDGGREKRRGHLVGRSLTGHVHCERVTGDGERRAEVPSTERRPTLINSSVRHLKHAKHKSTCGVGEIHPILRPAVGNVCHPGNSAGQCERLASCGRQGGLVGGENHYDLGNWGEERGGEGEGGRGSGGGEGKEGRGEGKKEQRRWEMRRESRSDILRTIKLLFFWIGRPLCVHGPLGNKNMSFTDQLRYMYKCTLCTTYNHMYCACVKKTWFSRPGSCLPCF